MNKENKNINYSSNTSVQDASLKRQWRKRVLQQFHKSPTPNAIMTAKEQSEKSLSKGRSHRNSSNTILAL